MMIVRVAEGAMVAALQAQRRPKGRRSSNPEMVLSMVHRCRLRLAGFHRDAYDTGGEHAPAHIAANSLVVVGLGCVRLSLRALKSTLPSRDWHFWGTLTMYPGEGVGASQGKGCKTSHRTFLAAASVHTRVHGQRACVIP